MNVLLKAFILYCIIIFAFIFWWTKSFYAETTPSIRQGSEEMMVDTANFMAELIVPYVKSNDFKEFDHLIQRYQNRMPNALIWGHLKTHNNLEFYITDEKGIVIYHSLDARMVGQDFSNWRDVRKTLKGSYGARTTRANFKKEKTSIMYVAAPIVDNNKIIGVISTMQPYSSLAPFIKSSKNKTIWTGVILAVAFLMSSLFIGLFFQSVISKLIKYVNAVRKGKNVRRLVFKDKAFNELALSVHEMRMELDGKDYIEQYTHTLTHEIKTPLAALSGATQILKKDISQASKDKFIHNIECEVDRMQALVERVLLLAKVENFQLEEVKPIAIKALLVDEIEAFQLIVEERSCSIKFVNKLGASSPTLIGDDLLLRIAIRNLLYNATEFCNPNSVIQVLIYQTGKKLIITVENEGPVIPDYALERIFERFFSTPRPHSGRKSSGLGLCLTKEIADLHNAEISLENTLKGVKATFTLNLA